MEWGVIGWWRTGQRSQLVSVSCPQYIYALSHRGESQNVFHRYKAVCVCVLDSGCVCSPGQAYRQCAVSGDWEQVPSINRTWANYTECTAYLASNHRSQEEVGQRACVSVCVCV